MRIIGIKIKNFRCYREEIYFSLSSFTAIIGCNDAGKSSVLDALDIFINNTPIDFGDASLDGDKTNVCITVIFSSLPDSLILDADYPTSLQNEYLVNLEGNLEITKYYDCSGKGRLKGIYLYANHPSAHNIDDLLGLTNTKLKARLKELDIDSEGIDEKINSQIRKRIWERSKGGLSLLPKHIQIDKEAMKNIWEQIKTYLPIYALFKSDRASTDQDEEAQDPMRVAIKEAIKMEAIKFKALEETVSKEVLKILELTVEKLREMDPALANELTPHIEISKPENIFKISLTGDGQIPINKRGSGIRRLILLNFFRAEVERLTSTDENTHIIYAIEEPETSQHPNNQKMLIRALMELADHPLRQVFITTHTPMLNGILPVKSLRYIELKTDGSRKIRQGDDNTYQLIVDALGILPDNRVKIFIAVEGNNDIKFLINISKILHQFDPKYCNLEKMRDSGELIFIIKGGSNLQHWVHNSLQPLGRPEFHLYDKDVGEKTIKQQAIVDQINNQKHKYCRAILTGKREIENYIHPLIIEEVFGNPVSFGDESDVPMLVAEASHRANGSNKLWEDLNEKEREKKISRAKERLCNECAKKMTVELIEEIDTQGNIKNWFTLINELIAEYENNTNSAKATAI